MEYLILPRIRVQRANALATPWAVTLAPVFACTLFAHALGRDIGEQPKAIGFIHHDAQLLAEGFGKGGYGLYPQQFRAATYIDGADYSSKNKYALSLQPTVSMNLELSLVLLFEDVVSLKKITTALRHRRIAGGLIIDHGEPVSRSSLEDAMRVLPGGFFLVDRSEELRTAGQASGQSSGKGRIETLLSLINDPPSIGEKRRWLSPAVMGYAALTDFEQRDGVRDNRPHAFAEPLMGLVEYHSVAKHKKLSIHEQREFPCFWRGKWLTDDVFVTQSESLINLELEMNDE